MLTLLIAASRRFDAPPMTPRKRSSAKLGAKHDRTGKTSSSINWHLGESELG